MEIIGLFMHLETVAVTAVVFLFCSLVELVFHILQLRGTNKSGHSGSPPRLQKARTPLRDRVPEQDEAHSAPASPRTWQAGTFLPPFFYPPKPGSQWVDAALTSAQQKAGSQSPRVHPSLCEPAPTGLSVPCRDPFKAVRSMRV